MPNSRAFPLEEFISGTNKKAERRFNMFDNLTKKLGEEVLEKKKRQIAKAKEEEQKITDYIAQQSGAGEPTVPASTPLPGAEGPSAPARTVSQPEAQKIMMSGGKIDFPRKEAPAGMEATYEYGSKGTSATFKAKEEMYLPNDTERGRAAQLGWTIPAGQSVAKKPFFALLGKTEPKESATGTSAQTNQIDKIIDNARQESNDFIKLAEQDKLYNWDKLGSDVRGQITGLAKNIAQLKSYKAFGQTHPNESAVIGNINKTYQYLKNEGMTPTWAIEEMNALGITGKKTGASAQSNPIKQEIEKQKKAGKTSAEIKKLLEEAGFNASDYGY